MTRLTPERLAEIRHAINSSWGVTISEQLILLRELDAVTKELDEARKDSARIDWLMIRVSTGGWLLTHGRIGEGPESQHYDLRDAIDAAMSKEPNAQ